MASEQNRLRLCAAFRDLVDECGGPVEASKVTRVGAPYLSKYGAAHENMMAPIDVVVALECFCGKPVVTRVLAELAGFTIVKETDAIPAEAFMQDVSEIAKDSGAVLSTIGEGLADGRLDARDAKNALPAVRELIETATGMADRLEQVRDGAEVVELKTRSA